ncbi:hypothetical protein OO013_15485 [Mangrovivirga sp. M17]|uniref:Seryl-tRNA synthetase n=1 Tax=Mangrovivirga halotolerans TaxID=2993936 RepID=A0ABT3RU23_9BACT|nr:hypothetical protein [Mangrovivirga halotolerans]MCX2745280.1 hypothetical protein [Mangrovivirga halotolerans]
MRKSILIILFTAFSTILFAGEIKPLDKETIKNMTDQQRTERVRLLEERIKEIENMDLKTMERPERKEIKKELRGIKKEMKQHASGGIYIGAGVLILIIILLILL